MDFFFRTEKQPQQNPQETIEKLCDRVMTSTLLEDRRAAVLGLKGLAKDYKLDVGTKGMPGLVQVLKNDRMDIDIIKAALEALQILCTPEKDVNENNLGVMFSEIYIKDPSNVTVLLEILEETDFYIRFDVIQLFSTLLSCKPSPLQDAVLTSPMGISRLIELVDDRREIIRNEGLLLLIDLTKSNPDIQKIIAFENAFDQLFRIIFEEGLTDGGIVVHDCLQLMLNLLQFNVSNQNLFRENGCIQKLAQMFISPIYSGDDENEEKLISEEKNWTDTQKGTTTNMVIKLVRVLVGAHNPNAAVNQNIMKACNLIYYLSQLAIASHIPKTIRAQALCTFGDVIRGNSAIQNDFIYLSSVSLQNPDTSKMNYAIPLRNFLLLALERTDLDLRMASFYVISSYLHENSDAQVNLAQGIRLCAKTPQKGDLFEKDLIEALFDFEDIRRDPYIVFFTLGALIQIIRENQSSKEALMATAILELDEEVSFFDKCSYLMIAAGQESWDPLVTVSCLEFMSVWLYNFPVGVKHLLSEGSHVQYLLEQVISCASGNTLIQGLAAYLMAICYEYNDDSVASFSRSSLQSIIISRVGSDVFLSRIDRLKNSKALTLTYPENHEHLEEIVFDEYFVELFRSTSDYLARTVATVRPKGSKKREESISKQESEALIKKDQDICALKKELEQLKLSIENETTKLHQQIQLLQQQVTETQSQLQQSQSNLTALEHEQEDLLVCLADQDMKMKSYKKRLMELGQEVSEDEEEYDDDDYDD